MSIMGHSMGGGSRIPGGPGAQTQDTDRYRCTSRTPDCTNPPPRLPQSGARPAHNPALTCSNPCRAPWGTKAFQGYLDAKTRSSPPSEWLQYDSSHLLEVSSASRGSLHILVDVGSADPFYEKGQLEPKTLESAAKGREAGEVEIRFQDGFNHSYYFVRNCTDLN